ncbi:Mrp/NBP35 family ATP-binding protein [Desulforhabdus amnigena]|uniref:Iron-sulfur cluster carrier protein n=1 Tax=Desulforhabdus amnigena TaxID=40218 RepID=A0A9W6CVK7_9BACT|nr:Mrp/NBP35 family ATP-binding protein [Desulforhabdus amnigena]GLI33344.1 iron-sulfur cluster carrier protein [Desulforhabdus amnigena]
MVTENQVREALDSVLDPELKKSITELEMVRNILISDGEVKFTLALTTLRCPMKEKIVKKAQEAIEKIPGVSRVEVALTAMSEEELHRLFPKHPLKGIEKTAHFIAVASGKGGVGKTTVALNLALALKNEGFKVGLLDADVYGPSIPVMMGLSEKPQSEAGMIVPLEKFGLKVMSFGFLLEESHPLIWRGPLVGKAVKQLLNDVMWGELDYLVVDLPPGTGDPSITVAQSIPTVSLVVVTTPQEVALADVKKAINMFKKMDISILGIVENMSYFKCAHSDEKIEIFGAGGGERLSQQMDIPLLGKIPIDLDLRRGEDEGRPGIIDSPDSETSIVFKEIARQLAASFSKPADAAGQSLRSDPK